MVPINKHTWQPITDLPQDWGQLKDDQVSSLVKVWHEQAEELRSRNSVHLFLEKLKRRWAVETGALEDIYQISDGATKTLIERGLDAALTSHDEVDQGVIAKIVDQLQAINGLYQFVSSQRSLSKSYLLELHQVITAHQDTLDGRDALGNYVKSRMPHGEWKKLPNNVEGPGGFYFEFCPPEQVEPELDRLLEMHRSHVANQVSPVIESAWLHHRFALIHPFADGNGRIARCLATLVLLRDRWLPLVVTRVDKTVYISALRAADDGHLGPLVKLFGDLQRKAIREALSLGEEALEESTQLQGILESIRTKFSRRNAAITGLVKRANLTADTLHHSLQATLNNLAINIDEIVKEASPTYSAFAAGDTRLGPKAHYNTYQIVECAKKNGYFANLSAFRAWGALVIATEVRTEILFSIHGVGYGSTGVLGCSGMIYVRRQSDEDHLSTIGDITPLSSEPFDFTYAEDPNNVQRRFAKWLDECIVAAVAKWRTELA